MEMYVDGLIEQKEGDLMGLKTTKQTRIREFG